MSDLKTTEANEPLKELDAEKKELTPEELNQIAGGGPGLKPSGGINHNQTCTFIL
jgi:hypothetical protein